MCVIGSTKVRPDERITVSVIDLLAVFRARWRSMVLVVLCCVATGAGLALVQTPLYASSTQLFVSAATDDSVEIYQGSLYSVQRVKSYEQLARSAEAARNVAAELDLEDSPAELQSGVSATVLPETTVVEITFADPSAARAQTIARGYAVVLVDMIDQLETPEGQSQSLVKVAVIDEADLPQAPFAPNWWLRFFVALFVGVVLGVVVAVVRHLLDNKVRDPQDVAGLISAPLLSVIGRFDKRDGDVEVLEGFRLLRTNLVFADTGHRSSRVYVVSSPSPGDGKTTVAIELAKSLAVSGRRVLLVDADLRKPNVGARTGLDVTTGLTSVIIGAVTLEEAVQSLDEWSVDVLTSGRIPPNPAELVETAIEPVLAAARAQYDAVVIDAAPLLPVSDTSGLATHVDGVIMVARFGVTTRRQLALARERLDLVNATLLGLVVNAVPSHAITGYGYGYGYGYRYEASGPIVPPAAADHGQSRSQTDGAHRAEPAAVHPPEVKQGARGQ